MWQLCYVQAPCGVERLRDLAGKDATKEYDMVGHSDSAREMTKHFLVGEYQVGC